MKSFDTQLSDAFRWALEDADDAATATADWLAREMDSEKQTAVDLLTDPDVPLATLRAAKDAYKTMRIVGETAADRRLGARLYLAAIAAGLVQHQTRISEQSERALRRGLGSMKTDRKLHVRLRDLAVKALRAL